MEALHERRRQIVRLHRQGLGPMAVAELAGVSWPTVRRTIDLYEQGGSKALKPGKRGSKPGDRRKLSLEQERLVRKHICEKRPEQLKLDFALWSRGAVLELVEREFGLRLGLRTVGDYLARWGFTPQKPIKRAYERNDRVIKQWKEEVYPAIAKQARTEGAEIHWLDETAVVNTDVRGRSYARRGRMPVVYAPGSRAKLSMISTVTNKGEACWEIIDGNFNIDRLLSFLQALIKGRRKKLYVIMDNLRAHHSKPVKQWLAENARRIAVVYLPSYAPELNPDERLNALLKQELRSKAPERSKPKLFVASTHVMTLLAADRPSIRSLFRDPHVRYAA